MGKFACFNMKWTINDQKNNKNQVSARLKGPKRSGGKV
jgi:hypothetical protein